MQTHLLPNTFLPELGRPTKGKVRDIYFLKDQLALVASDRISVFDRILPEPIQDKGAILTKLSLFWFEQTKDLVPNHLVDHPDPNVLLAKRCQPIKAEIIVRGFLAGSMWRDYQKGKRVKCGVPLPEGLKQNDPLKEPIVTPTTKSEEGHDEDITAEELIASGVMSASTWNYIKEAALKLYKRGCELLKSKGLILVDTKYEFGIAPNGEILLIDEIHTPDSSRFWFQDDYDRKEVKFPDKEFLREWLRSQGFTGSGVIPSLPPEIIEKVRAGYVSLYEAITGQKLEPASATISKRLIANLKQAKMIQGVFALIWAGSESDKPHVDKIVATLQEQQIPLSIVYASAHKDPRKTLELITEYNESLESLVCITVAGRSNALSGVLAANLKWPVIACPPFKDYSDYLVNIHSTLQMPSKVPSMTVIDPANAALAAARILKSMDH
ncbi:MAG TPA: phosphoribosylaminoimidazolesuccinocarboxamide synthase [Rhabdochlamydiaceae bacterium]|nr:phosphoribosylaminoimidazolesuccinocarboxamide synthase [Rhabdochlamydiaceae bacterium]